MDQNEKLKELQEDLRKQVKQDRQARDAWRKRGNDKRAADYESDAIVKEGILGRIGAIVD